MITQIQHSRSWNSHLQGAQHPFAVLQERSPCHHPGKYQQTRPGHMLTLEWESSSLCFRSPDMLRHGMLTFKGLLAVLYAFECFHTHLYNFSFMVEAEHKPLVIITLKNLTVMSPCLQWMPLHLQNDAIIRYMPGSKIEVLDGLSRLSSIRQRDESPLKLHVDHIAFSDTRLAKVHKETDSWSVLPIVYGYLQNRWTATCRQVPRITHKYRDMRDELTSDNSLLLKASEFVIPPQSHFYMTYMKNTQASPYATLWPDYSYIGLAFMEI